MKSKKITAWILLMAMLITISPSSLAFAAPIDDVSVTTASMTRDDSSVEDGTDLLLKHNADMEGVFNPPVDPATIIYLRRTQDFIIRAESESGQFYGADGLPLDNALQFAYLDVNGNPLELDNSDGFKLIPSTTEKWINIMDDGIQHTLFNLEEFWTKEDLLDKSKLTVSRIATADHMITAHVFNAVGDQFAGFIRVKSTDTNNKVVVEDYPIIADGKYPSVKEIKTETNRHVVGEYNDPVNLPVANDTFIASTDFETDDEDFETYEDAAGNKISPYVSRRYAVRDEDALLSALKNADESVWTMENIKITSLKIEDEEVSSGFSSVKYYIDNIQNLNDIAIETRKAGDVTEVRTDIGVQIVKDITDITGDFDSNNVYIGSDIVIDKAYQGMNILTIVIEDNAGLVKTNKYFFFIDTVAPEAKFNLVELNKNVKSDVSLFTVADVVTNRQQSLDLNDSADKAVAPVTLVSKLRAMDESGVEVVIPNDSKYQYRLLATKAGETAKDTDGDGENDVPEGYTEVVLDKEGNDLSGWKIWTGETETPVIDKEFDGIIQVRVQDRAGNWSSIVSTTSDGKETIITDNTNPVIDVKEYALNSNSDTTGNSVDEIINGTATDILVTTARVTEKTDGEIENEVIHTTTGDVAPWINDSAVLEVKITDEDLANEIRSSGLNKGQINVKAEFNAENENKKIKIWNKNGVDKKNVDDSFNLTEDYIFGTETDKDLTFYVEYEGTGVVDITVSVKDQADVNDGDVFSSIYKTQLRVDKINPYIIYKGYDITDDVEKEDLLLPNTEYDRETSDEDAKVDYEARNMPWGPNSQVLEVVVKDDDITSVQSKTNIIKFRSDKALDLYNGKFEAVASYAPRTENVVSLDICEKLANEKYESNVGYKFYLVYEGTGIAKVEFFADDSAKEPNVRDYPSVATAADAEPVLYDAMLRVDKINPDIKNAKLVETDADVEDKGWLLNLFTFNETDADVNTRKQMKITFEIVDETTTSEQSGVNIQNEKISGVDLMDVYDKYVEKDKTHLYDDEATAYITDDANDVEVDPNIDYILLPVEAGTINGTGGTFTQAASASNEDIEALVAKYLDKEYNADGDKCEWKKASWKDGGIVVPDEFQGAIVLRTIDRVGNIDYSEPITFVAESIAPMIDFLQQDGFIYSQNNYGWSKRPYDYVEIRVKDDNVENVDAWLENVFVNVTDLEENDISTKDTVKFAHKIHADDKTEEVDPTGYEYVSLADFAYEAAYGYDVIEKDGLVETLARDKDGYIHLGYVRVAESAKINITIFDKAKHNDADYSGNKLTATWTTRIDRTAPVIDVFELEKCDDDSFALLLRASDEESGLAPMWGDEDFAEEYNKYHKVEESFLYKWNDESDGNSDIYDKYTDEKGIINPGQYELPGLQYALLEEGDTIEDIEPWEFEIDPNGIAGEKTAFSSEGYYRDGFKKTKVWHNYNSAITPVVSSDFDGYIVVRAIDRAGNITVMGYAPTLDVTADDAWRNETQYINVKALDINGDAVSKVEYYGNNGLLYPESAKRDITTEALSGEGAFVEVVEEGITKVIVKASKSYADEKNITLGESGLRNDIWEGNLILGNPTATGYEDWKYQITDVKIDKTAPTFDFELKGDTVSEKDKKLTETDVAVGPITINIVDANDPTPNKDADTMSHIASGIKTIEWCAIPEGSEEEIWKNYEEDGGDVVATNFTGTIKIRVTDNAGNITVKSRRINIDGVKPIISISKSYDEKCSHEPVDVFVTVSESAEFSDVQKVEYTITHPVCIKEECTTEDCPLEDHRKEKGSLPLTGGTISVDKEGITTIKVTAYNKANVPSETAETNVIIHYEDIAVPSLTKVSTGEVIKTNDWILDSVSDEGKVTGVVNVKYPTGDTPNDVDNNRIVYYSLNGSTWQRVVDNRIKDLTAGVNTIRLQARCENCICESDVVTYVVNYDDGVEKPNISITYDDNDETNWKNDAAVITVTATKGASDSEVESIEYDLNGVKKYLGANGGNIVIQEEGLWKLNNLIITMKSGRKYIMDIENNAGETKFTELSEYTPLIPEQTDFVVVAKIDRTAPELDFVLEDAIDSNPDDDVDDSFALMSIVDAESAKKQHVYVTKLSDDMSYLVDEESETNWVKVYYAIVEKGAMPNWKPVNSASYGYLKVIAEGATTKHEIYETEGAPLINKAFDGTMMIKAVDEAGNETVVSKTVFTEGIAPEISITAPSSWQTEDIMMNVDIVDKGLSSTIESVKYTLYNGADTNGTKVGEDELSSIGGSIEITREGTTTVEIIAKDYAGNEAKATSTVKLDKTAPEYSRMIQLLGVYNEHEIPESEWNIIHDGWTYNHDVSLDGIKDIHSGIKKVNIKFTSADGATTETTLNSHQTSSSFSESGKYDLTLIDNAGNVRNISFAINKDLQNVINVIGVDALGKLNIAVTDGDDMLTFYKKENSESKYTKMYNGITDQLVDGKTGVRYIYGQNDSGKKSNTLYVIVAPSTEYGISLMSLNLAPNRYLNIDAEGGNVTVKKIDEIFNPGINKNISVGSVVEINEDGVYSITTND